MKHYLIIVIPVLLLGLYNPLCAQPSVKGQWKVTRYIYTTYAVDEKTIVKGPFTKQPENYHLSITDSTYSSVLDSNRITYQLKRFGKKYLLKRTDENGEHKVTIHHIVNTGKRLTFKTKSISNQNSDITKTEMFCERSN